MKKILLAATLVAACTTANAQVWLGGYATYSNNTSKNDISKTESTYRTISFQPTIGYDLNEDWSIYATIELGQHSNTYKNLSNSDSWDNSYGLGLYARRYWGVADKLRLYVRGGASYAINHVHGESENGQTIGIVFGPGASYKLTDHISLEANFGSLNYTHRSTKRNGTQTLNDIELHTTVGLGVAYYF